MFCCENGVVLFSVWSENEAQTNLSGRQQLTRCIHTVRLFWHIQPYYNNNEKSIWVPTHIQPNFCLVVIVLLSFTIHQQWINPKNDQIEKKTVLLGDSPRTKCLWPSNIVFVCQTVTKFTTNIPNKLLVLKLTIHIYKCYQKLSRGRPSTVTAVRNCSRARTIQKVMVVALSRQFDCEWERQCDAV